MSSEQARQGPEGTMTELSKPASTGAGEIPCKSRAQSCFSVIAAWPGTGSATEVSQEFYDPHHTNSSLRV